MHRTWKIKETLGSDLQQKNPEISLFLAKLLADRGITSTEKINSFLYPNYTKDVHDPYLFSDMKKAVTRIFTALANDEKIVIYGDYDADGVSGSVILYETLTALTSKHENISVFLPHRETDGYGLNTDAIDRLITKNTDLIITVDCGISNTKEVTHANHKKVDVIITDHHKVPENVPKAFAIIHPGSPGEQYPCKHLAGGAVAYKLMQALMIEHAKFHDTLQNGQSHEQFEKWLVDMVAIACVADMVPLTDEARSLTQFGLLVMNRTKRIGLQKLLLTARILSEENQKNPNLTAESIGYYIAPRINAAGRMNHANTAFQLLIEQDPAQATLLAEQLEQENNDRKQLSDELTKEAKIEIEQNQTDAPILFIAGDNWPTGLVGLIAGKLKEQYHKPTIVMSIKEHEIVGSGRSIDQFNLINGLMSMPDLFTKFGGHPMACGFSFAPGTTVETFKEKLINYFHEKTDDLDLSAALEIDMELPLSETNWNIYNDLQLLAPFGKENEEPIFLAKNVQISYMKSVGADEKHLIIYATENNIPKTYKLLGWRLNDAKNNNHGINWSKELQDGDSMDVVYRIGINEYNGNKELQYTIVDLRKTI